MSRVESLFNLSVLSFVTAIVEFMLNEDYFENKFMPWIQREIPKECIKQIILQLLHRNAMMMQQLNWDREVSYDDVERAIERYCNYYYGQ